MMEIRKAEHDDAGLLSRLHASCFADAWSESAFEALLASPATFALMVRSRGEDIGFVLARVAAGEAETLSLGVLPQARRRSAGKRLMVAAGEACLAAGGDRMFLEVGSENTVARNFYRHMGFREVGLRRGYYRKGAEDALTLRADLPFCGLGIGAELD